MCIISIFLCFALVPKFVPRTVDFHWYWYRILKFWYRDNTSAQVVRIALPVVCDVWFTSGSNSRNLKTDSKNQSLKSETRVKQVVGKRMNKIDTCVPSVSLLGGVAQVESLVFTLFGLHTRSTRGILTSSIPV